MTSAIVELLRPDRKKFLAALAFPGVLIILGRIWLYLFTPPEMVIVAGPKLPIITLVVSYLFSAIIYYPFVCSLVVLLEHRWRREKIPSGLKKLIIVGIVVLNPISLRIIIFLPFIIFSLFKPAQGLYVEEVIPGSPAEKGFNEWLEGKVIVKLNETEIRNIDDARKFFTTANEGDLVRITTSGGSISSVRLGKCEVQNTTKLCMGFKVKDRSGRVEVL